MKLFFSFLILIQVWNISNCAKILGVFPFPGYSQFILAEKLMAGLAERGHEVTVVSEFEPNEKIKNYETLKLQKSEPYDSSVLLEWTKINDYSLVKVFLDLCIMYSEALFKQTVVQDLLKSNRTFDLVIVENFGNEAHMGLGEHFKAPLVIFSSQSLHEWNSHFVGNIRLPSINPISLTSNLQSMNFFERFNNFWLNVYYLMYRELIYFPEQQNIMDKYFPNKMDVKKAFTSVEILLLNSHPLTTEPSLLTSSVIEIGSFHIFPRKLTSHIKNVLDDAKEGAVLFSLGSNLQCEYLSKDKLNLFLNVVRRLPYKVLWKCGIELSNRPHNLFTSKWLPQADILAHPNVIAFVTHSGLLSTTEAIYFGVPMVSIPIFADQPVNSNRAVKNGIAEKLDFLTMTENEFYDTVMKVTTNPRYKTKIQKMSLMIRDQPSKPLDRALHTIEFVLKYRPGKLLRSPALDLWWFQLYSLDAVLFIPILVILIYVILSFLFRKMCVYQKTNKKKRE